MHELKLLLKKASDSNCNSSVNLYYSIKLSHKNYDCIIILLGAGLPKCTSTKTSEKIC